MKRLWKDLSVKRLKQMFFIWLSNVLPLRGYSRYKFVRLGGVNIKGKAYIYRNVYFVRLLQI